MDNTHRHSRSTHSLGQRASHSTDAHKEPNTRSAEVYAQMGVDGDLVPGAVRPGMIPAGSFTLDASIGNVHNGTGEVIIDGTGVTVYNGKINLIDASGQSVLAASGFGGAWLDFLHYGLYNATFYNGNSLAPNISTPGVTAPAASNPIPYWGYEIPAANGYINPDPGYLVVNVTALNVDVAFQSMPVPVRHNLLYQPTYQAVLSGGFGVDYWRITPKIVCYSKTGTLLATITGPAVTWVHNDGNIGDGWYCDAMALYPDTAFASLRLDVRKTAGTASGNATFLQVGLLPAVVGNQYGVDLRVQSLEADALTVHGVSQIPGIIKTGTVNVAISNAVFGEQAVTFAAAFPGTPRVIATVADSTSLYFCTVNSYSSTGFTARAIHRDGATTTTNVTVHWMAIYGQG